MYYANIFVTRFVDEEYNLAIGKYITQNEVLYEDIITNHQPITDILSGLVQGLKTPPTFFYCDNCKGLNLATFLHKYVEVKIEDKGTNLHILPGQIQTLTKT